MPLFLLVPSIHGKSIDQNRLAEGDIIFHESKSKQATAIKLATKS